MRRQSGLCASHVPLMVLWKKHQITAHLVQRASMSVQLLLPLARDCAVMGQQKMQAWCERLWPNLHTQERLRLHAFADKEHSITLRGLLTFACAVLNVHRGSLQGGAVLCQR
jgi:hypothetical protein